MVNKIPLSVQAAAELELRRRQKDRADNCFICEIEALISEAYEEIATDPGPCGHSREQQEIESVFCQRLIENVNDIYGDSRQEIDIDVGTF